MAPAKKKQKLANGDTAVDHSSTEQDPTNESKVQAKSDEQHKRSLFVRSLPATTTTQSLTDLFSESYPIKHATAVIDPTTKQCRGYGFVTFADVEDAARAKEEFNGHTLDGKKIRIEIAEPRQRDAEKAPGADKTATPKQHAKEKGGPESLPQPSRLIVRNLPWTIKTSEQLGKLFLSFGKVKQAYIPKNKHGLLAGFGFVVLRGRKNAEKALLGVNGKEVDGRTLAVDWAVNKDVYEGMVKQADESAEGGVKGDGAGEEDEDTSDLGGVDVDDDADSVLDSGSELSENDGDELGSDVDVQMDNEEDEQSFDQEDSSPTLFARNLPFTCTDEDLEDHFRQFGAVRYARVVMDFNTERSKGTGFVCFYNKDDAESCLRNAPRPSILPGDDAKDPKQKHQPNSILQNEATDPTGTYSIDGRVLQLSRAVNKSEANRLTQEGAAHRRKRNDDKRRLYLLSEGTISSRSKLWEKLSTSEQNMREASAKQRKNLIESNPSLHLSLTRLSVRNIPRSVTSKDLKSLAREAVVGFATDVKAGLREKLSKEETIRGGAEMLEAEKLRKKGGKGVVRQAKVVFEGASGSKVEESTGAGRSRGYGFIEFYTHRCALMGLRWLNGHAVQYQVHDQKKSKISKEQIEDRKKRLIVEFAIENAQVVLRRKEREGKARERSLAVENGEVAAGDGSGKKELLLNAGKRNAGFKTARLKEAGALKRKREQSFGRASRAESRGTKPTTPIQGQAANGGAGEKAAGSQKKSVDEKLAHRNRIIGRKRAMRQARKGGK